MLNFKLGVLIIALAACCFPCLATASSGSSSAVAVSSSSREHGDSSWDSRVGFGSVNLGSAADNDVDVDRSDQDHVDGIFGIHTDLTERLDALSDDKTSRKLSPEERLKRFTAYRLAIKNGVQKRESGAASASQQDAAPSANANEWEIRVYGHDVGRGGFHETALKIYENRRIDEGEILPTEFEMSKGVSQVSRLATIRQQGAHLRQYGFGGKKNDKAPYPDGKGDAEPYNWADGGGVARRKKATTTAPSYYAEHAAKLDSQKRNKREMDLSKIPIMPTCPPPGGTTSDANDRCPVDTLENQESGDADTYDVVAEARRLVKGMCLSAEPVYDANATMPFASRPTVASMEDGTLVVVYEESPGHEGDPMQRLMYTVSRDTGATWSVPKPVIPDEMRTKLRMSPKSEWNPALARVSGAHQLNLFFSRSVNCREGNGVVSHYVPGGDVVLMTARFDTASGDLEWNAPRVLKRQRDTSLPTVTSNPPAILLHRDTEAMRRRATFVLPIWEEKPSSSATCNTTNPLTGLEMPGVAGVLRHSTLLKRALTTSLEVPASGWSKTGMLMNNYTTLTDGAIATLDVHNGHLVQLFRTLVGRAFISVSRDFGKTWSRARPTELMMPHTKLHVITLSNGVLVVAYNPAVSADARKTRAGAMLRNSILVAASADGGMNWAVLARIAPETSSQSLLNPTMIQRGCFVFIVHSVRISDAAAMSIARSGRHASFPMHIRMARIRISLFTNPHGSAGWWARASGGLLGGVVQASNEENPMHVMEIAEIGRARTEARMKRIEADALKRGRT